VLPTTFLGSMSVVVMLRVELLVPDEQTDPMSPYSLAAGFPRPMPPQTFEGPLP
jgi:hypothetical protein